VCLLVTCSHFWTLRSIGICSESFVSWNFFANCEVSGKLVGYSQGMVLSYRSCLQGGSLHYAHLRVAGAFIMAHLFVGGEKHREQSFVFVMPSTMYVGISMMSSHCNLTVGDLVASRSSAFASSPLQHSELDTSRDWNFCFDVSRNVVFTGKHCKCTW
jgi:hypothetical protein